jgi:N-acetylmuramoyl-L-alanine amidase
MRDPRAFLCASILALLGLAVMLSGQGAAPASPLVILTREGRTPLPTTLVAGQEMVALDDLAGPFNIAIREDSVANAVRVTYKDKSILLTPDQTLASVGGRLVSLPAPLTRSGRRYLVPVEFINRAFALVYEVPIELRKASRLLIVGTLKVPRVEARFEALGNDLRVVFDIAPTVGHAIIQEQRRLLVRFESDALDAAIPLPPAQNVLSGVLALDRNTIELDLGQRFASYRSSIPSSTPAASRIVVDLLSSVPDTTTAPAPSPPPPAGESLATLAAPRPAIATIVIDPGHGGDDVGARGPTGVQEKDVTLSVARHLKTAIEGRYGIRVLQTRDDDRHMGLDERAAYANNNKADLFISLHANASPHPDVKGAEVFYLGLDKYADQARRQAQLDGAVLPVFGGGTRQIDLVLWDQAQAKYIDQSAVLARLVDSQLRSKVDVSPLGIQQGPMRVLVGVNMSAVLIEMGYLTNRGQEQALASGAYQESIVQALTDAVAPFREYLEHGSDEPVTEGASPATASATIGR